MSEWGLPHTHTHIPIQLPEGVPNAINLKNTMLCKLYWLLKEIKIEYQYVAQGARRVNVATLECVTEAKFRLLKAPKLVYDAIQGAYSTYAQIDFSQLIQVTPNSKTLQLSLEFTEADIWSQSTFTTKPAPALATVHTLSIEVWPGHPIVFYLQSS